MNEWVFLINTKSGGTADDDNASVLYEVFIHGQVLFYIKEVVIVLENDWRWQRIQIQMKQHNEKGEKENEKIS